MLQPILKNNLPFISRLCKEHKVEKLYAFGSVCTDNFNEKSDVDLLYQFEENLPLEIYADNFFDFQFKLEDFLKREVDLVSLKQLSNPHFINVVNRTKTPIYE